MINDITESVHSEQARQHAEEALRRSNRALRLLNASIRVLPQAADKEALAQDISRILGELGGYRLVWVGYAEHDEAKTVRPIAHYGFEASDIDSFKITWGVPEGGRGPAGTAIRSGQIVFRADLLTDPDFAPGRERARQCGCTASVALPLRVNGETLGALNLYADTVAVFDRQEIELLQGLADNLAFGLQALRTHAEHEHAEAALRESEARVRRLFDQAPIGAAVVSLDGHILMANAALCHVTGYSAEDLTCRGVCAIMHPDDLVAVKVQAQRLERGETDHFDLEQRILRPDGTVVWTRLNMRLIRDPGGQALYFLPLVEDITPYKQAEEALSENEARFRALFEQAAVGVAQVHTLTGKFVRVNQKYCEIVGYPRQALELLDFLKI